MLSLLCDGSYEGMLSGVFEAHQLRPRPEILYLRPPRQLSLLSSPRPVVTDPVKAARVQRAIDTKLSPDSPHHVRMIYASGLEEAGTLALNYLRAGWQLGPELDEHLTHPAVLPVHQLSQRVGYEVHRLSGLVRFSLVRGDIYYAAIEPDYDVVGLLAQHFEARLADQNFVLHDLTRGVAALHRVGETRMVRLSPEQAPEEGGDPCVELWRAFYDAIAITWRLNPKLRRQHMPVRYHKHLPEMNRR